MIPETSSTPNGESSHSPPKVSKQDGETKELHDKHKDRDKEKRKAEESVITHKIESIEIFYALTFSFFRIRTHCVN